MTLQDMDICLNISAEPSSVTSKAKEQNVDNLVNSSKKNLKGRSEKRIVENQSKDLSDQSIAIKKRVKQKSLSAIVARKLNENNNKVENVHKDSKSSTHTDDKVKSAKISAAVSLAKTRSTRPDAIPSQKDNESSSAPIISFTKVTETNVGKTILAKKRNVSDVTAKKSLSQIYSEQTGNIQLNLLSETQKPVTKENKVFFTGPAGDSSNEADIEEHKKIKFKQKKENNHKNKFRNKSKDEPSEDSSKSPYKPTGKISSLFGHNPEIPHIGQRFVKPVNETVFTAKNFSDFNIHPFTVSNLKQNMNITKMTTVQQKAIPQIFSGKDILIRSQTGSGKTLAYSIPIIELLHKIRPKLTRNSGLRALIVVPTRELALQTYECYLKLVKPFTWIVPGYLIGGEKRKAEKARLRKGCNILIATPGRLLDHIKHTSALKLNEVKYLVLDEADRMFDMGYEKDISAIVSSLKVSCSDVTDSGYDPMQMLKQNSKKYFTDEETAIDDNENIADYRKDSESKNKTKYNDDDNNSEVESGTENNLKGEYHSNSDTDSDVEDFSINNKKKKLQKSSKRLKKQQDSVDQVENLSQNTENDTSTDSSGRQTILLSATLTHAVERLAGLTMRNPVFVDAAKENVETAGGNLSEVNEDLIVPQSVVQTYVVTPPKLRMVTLAAYITGKCKSAGQHKMVIFMATQDMVDYHTEILSSVLSKPVDEDDEDSDPLVDVEFFKLYGDMTQKERTEVFKTFRQARSGVLLCTDVAARGLDMPKVDCVVQYTGPLSARDYVHRIGRTARAGSSGSATIFLTPPEVEFVRMLESRRIRIKQEEMDDVLDKLLGPLSKHSTPHSAAIALQNDFETMVLGDKKLREKAYKAYCSWMRFYASYPRDMREIFNRKDLHLGHFAKSFALRDPPQRIGGIGKALTEKDSSKVQHKNRLTDDRPDDRKKQEGNRGASVQRTRSLKRVRMLNVSEYGSGLEPTKKQKRS